MWLLCWAPLPDTPEEAARRRRKEREKAKKQKEKDAQKAEALKAKEESTKASNQSNSTSQNLFGRLQVVTDRAVLRLSGGSGTAAQARDAIDS